MFHNLNNKTFLSYIFKLRTKKLVQKESKINEKNYNGAYIFFIR